MRLLEFTSPLSDLYNQDQKERKEYQQFVQNKANNDYEKGAKMYAEYKNRNPNDIFGEKSRLQQFIKMKHDFSKFTDLDWEHFWLLSQHVDFNINFQKKALEIIKKYKGTDYGRVNNGASYYEYLHDRISCATTGTQKYGTQNGCDIHQ